MNQRERTEQAALFLSELGRGIPDYERVMVGYAPEATVQTDSTGKKLNAGWWPKPWLIDKGIESNVNCYAQISSSVKTQNPKNKEMRYWRSEANFGHGLALMVDDIGEGAGSKGHLSIADVSSRLPPTAIVQTSPGNYQLWYFLDEPEESMRKFKAFLSCFVNKVLQDGGDNTIKDVCRLGRMPTGINNKRLADGTLKYADANGKPYCVELTSADYSRRYSCEEIAKAFDFRIVVPQKKEIVRITDEYEYDYAWLRMAVSILSKAKLGEGSGGTVVENQSGKYRIKCPWGETHTNGDPYGAYFRGPIPGAEVEFVFGCAHDSCRKVHKRTWSTFVDEVVMPKILGALNKANYNAAPKPYSGE